MRSWTILVLASFLAGCASPSDEAVVEEVEPCLVTSATDESCNGPALNGTVVDRPHLHDYWQGKDRLVLEDVTLDASTYLCTELGEVVVLRPADGDTIIQGTAQVEVAIELSEPAAHHRPGEPELWLKTAADSEPQEVGALDGEPIVVETTNEMDDLPHQQLSAWAFHVMMRPTDPTGCFSYAGEITMHVEIVRGHEIPLFPGHTDRWEGAMELPLVDVEHNVLIGTETSLVGGACWKSAGANACPGDPIVPADGFVVPHDATQVQVVVEAQDASPLRSSLWYHGAVSREWVQASPAEDDGTARTYLLDVGKSGDGPYALQSQWVFMLLPEGGEGASSGAVHVSATVLKG